MDAQWRVDRYGASGGEVWPAGSPRVSGRNRGWRGRPSSNAAQGIASCQKPAAGGNGTCAHAVSDAELRYWSVTARPYGSFPTPVTVPTTARVCRSMM